MIFAYPKNYMYFKSWITNPVCWNEFNANSLRVFDKAEPLWDKK